MNHKCQLHTYLERHLIQRWRFEALEAPFRGSSIPTRSSIPDQRCSSILKKESNAGHRCGPQPGWEIRARRVGRALTPPGIYTRRFLLTTLKTQLAVKPGVWVRYWFVLRAQVGAAGPSRVLTQRWAVRMAPRCLGSSASFLYNTKSQFALQPCHFCLSSHKWMEISMVPMSELL